jgi:flagellar L-ring protein precursor FlgH
MACAPLAAPAQSLWNSASVSIVSDRRASAVGDTLTILVQHSATATKDNSTSTSKKSSIDAALNTFMYTPAVNGLMTKKGQLPALNAAGSTAFDGSGKINNSEAITDKITVTVVDVLPNRNMVVEGTRQTSFSGESQQAVLRGIVRSDDITAANTVYSYNLADATIKFIGKGTVSDSTRKGWAIKIWDKVNPF